MIAFVLMTLAVLFIGGIVVLLVFAKVAAKIYRKTNRHGYGYGRHLTGHKAGLLMSLLGMAAEGRRRHGHHRHYSRRQRHHGGDWDHDYEDYDD